MIKITMGNSYSSITGITREQHAELADTLSVKTLGFGFFYIGPKTFTKCYVKKGAVWVWDAKGIPRRVVNSRFKPYSSLSGVKDAMGKREKVFAKGHIFTKRPLIDRKGNFGTGLLKRAFKVIESWRQEIHWNDERIRPKPASGLFNLEFNNG